MQFLVREPDRDLVVDEVEHQDEDQVDAGPGHGDGQALEALEGVVIHC